MALLAIFIALVFAHSLVSGRLERTIVTTPIVFTAVGSLTLLFLPGLQDRPVSLEAFLHVAEVGLVLLLFTDASRTAVCLAWGALLRLLTKRFFLTGAVG